MNMPKWPEWETVREIGRGSFGGVYEIHKPVFGRTDKAALKVITIPQSSSDIAELYNDGYDAKSITDRYKNYLEDIVKEYNLMAELKGNHNIVYCDDLRYVQHDDGIGWDIYIKMELLTPLTQIYKEPVDEQQVIKLGIDMCNALIACKSKHIIHRDIKPQNIFVTENGDFKLGDFGIAKTTEKTTGGTKTGTYKYMAPEVYNNQPYGASSDLYSLGMVLYWMLNQRRTPFLPLPPAVPTATQDNEARMKRMSGEKIPAPLDGSDALKKIVLKACEYNVSERFLSPQEMKRALEICGGYVQPTPPNPPTPFGVDNSGIAKQKELDNSEIERIKNIDIKELRVSVGKDYGKVFVLAKDCIKRKCTMSPKLGGRQTLFEDIGDLTDVSYPEDYMDKTVGVRKPRAADDYFKEKEVKITEQDYRMICCKIREAGLLDVLRQHNKLVNSMVGADYQNLRCSFADGSEYEYWFVGKGPDEIGNIADILRRSFDEISTRMKPSPDEPPQPTVVPDKKKSKGLAIALAVFPYTGWFGVHDFYLGKKKSGIWKACTINFLIFGWLYDIFMICIGKYKDKDGNPIK